LPPLPTKASAKAALATTAVIAATMTDTATATATALTLAVTVLSKNMKISKLDRSFCLVSKKKTGVTWNLASTGSYDNIGIVLRTGFYERELRWGKIVNPSVEEGTF
jgi:hypothetical protein